MKCHRKNGRSWFKKCIYFQMPLDWVFCYLIKWHYMSQYFLWALCKTTSLGFMSLHIVFNKLYSIWKHFLFDRYLQSQAETEESPTLIAVCADVQPCIIHQHLVQYTVKDFHKIQRNNLAVVTWGLILTSPESMIIIRQLNPIMYQNVVML